MRSTLFHIPAEFAGVPIFGFGWLLLVWALTCIGFSIWLLRRPDGKREIGSYVPFFLIIAAVIALCTAPSDSPARICTLKPRRCTSAGSNAPL